jgi:hypothetical protein
MLNMRARNINQQPCSVACLEFLKGRDLDENVNMDHDDDGIKLGEYPDMLDMRRWQGKDRTISLAVPTEFGMYVNNV